MSVASFGLTEALVSIATIFLFVMWFWILITIISDLFRDHETSGVAKAFWILFLILIPFLAALIYLIVRGHGMRDRAIAEQAEVQKQMNQYIREQAAAASPADELHKLSELKDKGVIDAAEYERLKAKITG
jgi:ABC-type transport system involved in multi-copper enzyme maturation permease subunit